MCNLPISKRNLPPPPRPFIRTNCFCYCIFIFVLAELIWNFVLTGFTLLGSPEISMVSTTKDVQKLNADKKNTTASLFSHWPGTLDPEMDRIKEGPKNLSVSQALGVRGVITIPIKTSHHFYKYVDKISLAYFSPKMSTSPTPPPPRGPNIFCIPKKDTGGRKSFLPCSNFQCWLLSLRKHFARSIVVLLSHCWRALHPCLQNCRQVGNGLSRWIDCTLNAGTDSAQDKIEKENPFSFFLFHDDVWNYLQMYSFNFLIFIYDWFALKWLWKFPLHFFSNLHQETQLKSGRGYPWGGLANWPTFATLLQNTDISPCSWSNQYVIGFQILGLPRPTALFWCLTMVWGGVGSVWRSLGESGWVSFTNNLTMQKQFAFKVRWCVVGFLWGVWGCGRGTVGTPFFTISQLWSLEILIYTRKREKCIGGAELEELCWRSVRAEQENPSGENFHELYGISLVTVGEPHFQNVFFYCSPISLKSLSLLPMRAYIRSREPLLEEVLSRFPFSFFFFSHLFSKKKVVTVTFPNFVLNPHTGINMQTNIMQKDMCLWQKTKQMHIRVHTHQLQGFS